MTPALPALSTNPADLEPTEIADRVGQMLARTPAVDEITVSRPARVFGGNARLAWSCEASWIERGARHEEPLILLVRAAGSQVTTDPAWEVAVLERVVDQGVRAPRVWAHDLGGELLGGPAVLLARMPGQADPVAYLAADQDLGRSRTLDLARAAAELHRADPRGLSPGDPLVDHWRDRYLAGRLEPLPALSWLYDWLTDHQTEPERAAVVHGDFRPGNVLYDGERITALLDWEMAHLGDPVEDLAWAYRALWSPERFVPLTEFVAAYEAAGGAHVETERLLWHRVFCEVKFATISLAAARSVVDGHSHNLRLIDRARTVAPALARCLDWIATGKPC
jgi:aminoglycoside phosphotransferase (APT) family kinase protein